MPITCPRCGAANSTTALLCSQCGAVFAALSDDVTRDHMAAVPSVSGEPASEQATAGALLSGKYRILGEVARGGMGVVYRAEDMQLGRTVALKFLSAELMRDAEARRRFLREAQIVSELDHPNICTIHEVNEAPSGQMYIAMAYYKGESLKDRIKRGALPLPEAVDIAAQMARGLEKAHQRGIVHRDVKPANVLITEDDLAKIVDFGLAKSLQADHMTKTGTTMGTVAYMSPEQATGQEVDHRSDLWALGVVLYEMLTGRQPFTGQHQAALLYAIAHAKPLAMRELNPAVPLPLERIVQRALEKKPQLRYQSALEMLGDLQAHQDELRVGAARPLTLRYVFDLLRQPKVAAATIVLVLALGAAGWWLAARQAKVRWAREVAIPQIERLLAEGDAWRESTEAFQLAEQAAAILPGDTRIADLMSQSSLRMNIRTTPPGAKVYVKEYKSPDREWRYLGESPLGNFAMPIGVFRWKLEKDGFEPVLAAAPSWDIRTGQDAVFVPYSLERVLDRAGSIPPGMTRVTGGETAAGKLDDFFIDVQEVTNRQYKEFVSRGGYKEKKYWKQKLLRAGKEVSWEQAMREFVDQSGQSGPATWQGGDFPEGQENYPVSGISWYEAAAYAEFAGKSLPTAEHWGLALGVQTPMIMWPQLGGFAVFGLFSNFRGKGGPVAAGSLQGITSYGAVDMAGNIREWCWNETPKGRALRGGAWNDNGYMFGEVSQAPAVDRSATNGFRTAVYRQPEQVPAAAFQPSAPREVLDLRKEKPVSDTVFQVYRGQFAYDKTELNARVESRKENPGGWTLEKITFDTAYGGERVVAYLFLPKNASPPYQTVVYFPGGESISQKSSKDIETYYEFPLFLAYIVKSGRAVVYPVYKGMFERGNDALASLQFIGTNSHQFRELLIQQTKDLQRSLDYLGTRSDIDRNKLAYYGMSGGAEFGPVMTAVEQRFKASVWLAGGANNRFRPEVSQVNYAPHVKIPTLMVNGRYDTIFPVETSSQPIFDLLGTPPDKKRLKLCESDHIPPRNEFIKETLAWLDRYLGPVK